MKLKMRQLVSQNSDGQVFNIKFLYHILFFKKIFYQKKSKASIIRRQTGG